MGGMFSGVKIVLRTLRTKQAEKLKSREMKCDGDGDGDGDDDGGGGGGGGRGGW